MALGTEIASWGYFSPHLEVSIHKMGDTHHRSTRLHGRFPAVAVQASVEVLVDLVITDGVGNHRRLFRVVAHFPLYIPGITSDGRGRQVLPQGSAFAQPVW